MKKTGFGIIGPGGIANRFATVLGSADEAQLVAVASRDRAKAEEFAGKHGAKTVWNTYAELIADPEVEIVYVATTHNFHFEIVKQCLEGGKPVICEKPLAVTGREAEELAALSEKTGVLLMEAMWTRCIPAVRKAREWVAAGLIGKVTLIDASFSFNIPFLPEHRLYRPDLAGGALLDAGVYPIEFAIGMVDEAPADIQAVASICETGVDDFVAMSARFPCGALATLSTGFHANTRRDASVYGTGGKIVVYDFLGAKRCERFDDKDNLLESFEETFEDGFIFEIRHVCELRRDGLRESPLIPHRDTIACAKAFDRVLAQIHGKQQA